MSGSYSSYTIESAPPDGILVFGDLNYNLLTDINNINPFSSVIAQDLDDLKQYTLPEFEVALQALVGGIRKQNNPVI
tara:strand:+ start:644 stop:874 length:231 start_codon:yes stop_codon:yes gene_type:complete